MSVRDVLLQALCKIILYWAFLRGSSLHTPSEAFVHESIIEPISLVCQPGCAACSFGKSLIREAERGYTGEVYRQNHGNHVAYSRFKQGSTFPKSETLVRLCVTRSRLFIAYVNPVEYRVFLTQHRLVITHNVVLYAQTVRHFIAVFENVLNISGNDTDGV